MITQLAAGGEVSHDALLGAMVALFGLAITSPVAVMLVQNRSARRSREQDSVERAQIADELAATSRETARSLGRIHGLVNSNLMAAQQRELDASRAALSAMREALKVKQDAGLKILPDTHRAIEALERQIEALAAEVSARKRAADAWDELSARDVEDDQEPDQ